MLGGCQEVNEGVNANQRSPTVMTPVAAVTPASPNKAVAASVTNAVAAMLTTLFGQRKLNECR
jgi:hypothetical protein